MSNTTTLGNTTITAECQQTVLKWEETCKEFMAALNTTIDQLPQDIKDCSKGDSLSPFKSCKEDQKKAGLEKVCPGFKKLDECSMKVFSCHEESKRVWEEGMKETNSDCAPYFKSDSQGLSSMMPWTLLLLLFV